METPDEVPRLRRARPTTWVAAVPVVVYFAVVVAWCPNGPYYDDYFAILEPVVRIEQGESWLHWMLAQNNEHRVATTRFLGWITWLLTGEVQFWVINLIGNLLLLVGGFALVRILRIRSGELVILAALLFNFSLFRVLSFPMVAVSNIGVYVFCLLGLWAVFRSKPVQGIGHMVLSALSQANGLAVFPIAAVGLALRRQWRACVSVGAAGVVVIGLYLWHFDPQAQMSPLMPDAGASSAGPGARWWYRPIYFIVQVGGLVGVNHQALGLPLVLLMLPACAGVVLLALHAWLWRSGRLSEFPALQAFLVFLLAALAAAALARVDSDPQNWLQARYKLVSCLYAAPLIVLMARHCGMKIRRAIIVLSCCFWIMSLVFLVPHYGHFASYDAPLRAEGWAPGSPTYEIANTLLSQARSLGVWSWH